MMAQRIYEQCIAHREAAMNHRKLKSVKLVRTQNTDYNVHVLDTRATRIRTSVDVLLLARE